MILSLILGTWLNVNSVVYLYYNKRIGNCWVHFESGEATAIYNASCDEVARAINDQLKE